MNAIYKNLFLSSLLLAALVSGCVKQSENYCPEDESIQGINVSFYSRNACQDENEYPDRIKDLSIFVFNNDDILADFRKVNDIEFSSDINEKFNVEEGLYTVLAWSGIDNQAFDIEAPVKGITTKTDLLLSLKRTGGYAESIGNVSVYFGESRAVYVSEAEDTTPIYENAAVNMLEQTNRISVSVEGLQGDPEEYEIIIESKNGSMEVGGAVAEDELIRYANSSIVAEGILYADFTTLKLETGVESTLIIRNKVTNKEVFRGSLLGTLILKNPYINLNCDHDFEIAFTVQDICDCGTYMLAEITINDWVIHSYQTDF